MTLLNHRFTSLALIVIFVLSMAVPMVHAQDEMMTHTCDSTTITLLFIAESDYGFHSMMDTSTFEKGQFAPMFDAMMAMMEDMGDDAMMEETPMAEDDAMMDDTMMDDSMMLMAPVIADEDPACTDLRTELETFFYDHYSMMMMDESGG